jgi:hypothetical protein
MKKSDHEHVKIFTGSRHRVIGSVHVVLLRTTVRGSWP